MQITQVIDRDGWRIRLYYRKTTGPTKKVRREMSTKGFTWCKECQEFYLSINVSRGICIHHRSINYKKQYHKNDRIKEQKYRRRLAAQNIPPEYRDFLFDKFEGLCAYCGSPATDLDHFFPVKLGGQSTPDNLLPACGSCNSRKRCKHPSEWPFIMTDNILDILIPSLYKSGQIHHLLN